MHIEHASSDAVLLLLQYEVSAAQFLVWLGHELPVGVCGNSRVIIEFRNRLGKDDLITKDTSLGNPDTQVVTSWFKYCKQAVARSDPSLAGLQV